jgi:hypothetical protein
MTFPIGSNTLYGLAVDKDDLIRVADIEIYRYIIVLYVKPSKPNILYDAIILIPHYWNLRSMFNFPAA